MTFYKRTIRSDYNTDTPEARRSWMSNCIDFINESTGMTLTYEETSSSEGISGYIVHVPVEGSFLTQFGILISTSSAVSNYFSNIVHNRHVYSINGSGNVFDFSDYYRADVIVFHTPETLHVLAAYDGEYHTMLLLDRYTEITTGTKYWGCSGFIATSPTTYVLEDLTLARNDATSGGALDNEISIANAITENGRFSADNVYSYYISSATVLPEFVRFTMTFDDDTVKEAVLLGSNTIEGGYGEGKYLRFAEL